MARGRKTSLTIRLTPAERLTLLTWQRATSIPAGLARRARIILLLADGLTITDLTGSFNFTKAAEEKNAENLLVIKEVIELVQAYEATVQAHAAHAHPYMRQTSMTCRS